MIINDMQTIFKHSLLNSSEYSWKQKSKEKINFEFKDICVFLFIE